MEILFDSYADMYEVEKIINRKTFRNKKYYLIKWLCYPINQCTWEPKSSLKHLNYLLEDFEARYPFSVDQDMYNIFCEEVNKKKKRIKKKGKKSKESENEKKFLAKKKKIEFFSDEELNENYLDKLKIHLYINLNEKQKDESKISNDILIIDLSSTNTPSEENIVNNPIQQSNLIIDEEKKDSSKLKMPQLI